MPALDGIRVLDLSTIVFGPYASLILADYGADVVKIEPPGGDATRLVGPAAEPGLAALFLGLNRNKRSVVLDLKQPEAVSAMLRLVDGADVVMHSMRPAKLARLGLDPDSLCTRNPRLVYAGLHGFAEAGPYAGRPVYDDVVQGLSGFADLMDRQTGQPQYLPTIVADKTAGLVAAHAILAALFQRERTGEGQRIEVPMFESTTSFLLVEHLHGRHLVDRPDLAAGYARPLAAWRRPYATRDGHVCVLPYTDEQWRRFFERTGHPEHLTDPRFANLTERTRHIEEVYAVLGEIIAERGTADWLALCDELDIPAAPVNRLDDLERDPQLVDTGFFQEITHREHRYRFPTNPVRMERSRVDAAMPPALGEHTIEVLRAAGLERDEIDRLLASGTAVDGIPD